MPRPVRLQTDSPIFIVLNGPLGIGKSTLAEALADSIHQCVMLNGDKLIAATPPPADEIGYLHSTIALLIPHHRQFGYRHFVIDHFWSAPAQLDDLKRGLLRVEPDADVRCFLLTLPLEDNLRRIRRRQLARVIDEQEFEDRNVVKEREMLSRNSGLELGEPFEVSAPPSELVAKLILRLGLQPGPGL